MFKRSARGGRGTNQYQQKGSAANVDRSRQGGIAAALGQGEDPWVGFSREDRELLWGAGVPGEEAQVLLRRTTGWDQPAFAAATLWKNRVNPEDVAWHNAAGHQDPGSVVARSTSNVTGLQDYSFTRAGYEDYETQALLANSGVSGDPDHQMFVTDYKAVGITDPAQIAGYAAQGIKPVIANHWRSQGFDNPAAIRAFEERAIEPLDATWYMRAGVDNPDDMSRLAQAGVSSVAAVTAQSVGATTVDQMIKVSRKSKKRRPRI